MSGLPHSEHAGGERCDGSGNSEASHRRCGDPLNPHGTPGGRLPRQVVAQAVRFEAGLEAAAGTRLTCRSTPIWQREAGVS